MRSIPLYARGRTRHEYRTMLTRKRGCLIALVFVGVAALTSSIILYFHVMPSLRELAASNLVFEMNRRLDAYHREFGDWPEGDATDVLMALRGRNPGGLVFIPHDGFPIERNLVVDAWKHPVYYITDDSGRLRAISPGKNGIPGDKDDIDESVAAGKAATIHPDGIPRFDPVRPESTSSSEPENAPSPAPST